MSTWDVVLEMPASTGAFQEVNSIPLPLEGEYRGVHCMSKLDTAMVAESHGVLKQLYCVLGKNSFCIIPLSLVVLKAEAMVLHHSACSRSVIESLRSSGTQFFKDSTILDVLYPYRFPGKRGVAHSSKPELRR